MVDDAVIGGCVSLAVEVGLDLSIVATDELPVDFIQIGGLKHNTRDYASTSACFHGHLNLSEEDEEIGGDGGSLTRLLDCEDGAITAILDSRSRRCGPGGITS